MTGFPTIGQIEPAKSITLPNIYPEAKRYLERHGCTLKEEKGQVTLFYPEGTTKQEIYPRTMCKHYRILLPDGTGLWETYSWHSGESYLYLREDPNAGK